MSYYYDEETDVKYYDPAMVVEFRQLENLDEDCDVEDMRVFLTYDEDDDLIYIYGSRKSDEFDRVEFSKSFDSESHAYDFLNILLGLGDGYRVNTSVYCMSNLTDYSTFDDFVENSSSNAEISGYNRQRITLKKFRRYMSVLF